MSENLITFNVENQIAKISLNRPDVLNSFNRLMALELLEVFEEVKVNDNIRAVYLTGNGRAFCAGQDLAEAVAEDGPDMRNIVKETYNPIILSIRSIEKPFVCAVNGIAAGAGANIAFACDITVAAESANFIQAFSKIGLIPDSGGTFFLPRLVGPQKAAALTFLGEKLSAADAEKMNLIYKVFPDEILAEESLKIAQKLAKMPTKGIGLTKRALNLSLFNNLEDQLDVEEELQSQAGQTHDYNEGVKAFLEKRKPEFKGK